MKHLKHLFTALLLLCSLTATAHDFYAGGIYYNITNDTNKTVEVTYKGNDYDSYSNEYTGSVVIPESVTYNGTTYSVTSIGDCAFRSCYGLTSVTIPNSVTSIGYSAFNGCKGLTSIVIPNSVTSIGSSAFNGCKGLTSIVIPNSVTSIGSGAFSNCSGLTSITIPNSVTSIGNQAFAYCSGLTSITIPNSVTSIGNYAFQDCYGLTNIEIPNSVTSIENDAFEGCTGLTSIEIPNSVTSIGNYAFYKCSGLTSITIPNSVKSIGEYAFYKCSGLKTVYNLSNLTFSKGSTSYGHVAYYADKLYNMPNGSIEGNFIFGKPNGVNSLLYYLGNETELTLPADYNGENYAIGADAFNCNSTITTIEIPNSVTSIGEKAFIWCSRLTSIEIPNSVTNIGDQAFQYCSSLTNVVIGNSVTSIGSEAFYGCHGLTSVTIGSGVRYIDWKAFAKCENLADVYCHATTVPSTNNNAFNESYPKYTTLHVPAEAINSYKTTAPWSSFGTIKEEVEVPVCDTPVISYSNGKIEIECETEGAEFITTVTNNYAKNYYSNNFELSATYNISVYATATGYKNSETVNATLCWIECDCNADDTGIINIPAKAALVTSNGGILSISCQLDGAEVAVYTTDGVLIATTAIENGAATVASGLSKGDIAIVKIGEKNIKVIVD